MEKQFDDVIDLSLGAPNLITDRLVIDKAYDDAGVDHTKYTAFSYERPFVPFGSLAGMRDLKAHEHQNSEQKTRKCNSRSKIGTKH